MTKFDSNGNYDVCRIMGTVLADDANLSITTLGLTMNQVFSDLNKMIHLNQAVEIKRLLAMAINDMEHGVSMAVKGMTTEGFVCERPKQGSGQAPGE